ncbi:hypothetical protein ACFYPW_30925 [Micromonospora zamorensis]|uniref:hypothetical protein n=1 Tax=Micromonospora zamorensis TaxID=709883 RepID=UPI0036CF0442
MITASHRALDPDRVAALGYCPDCYATGAAVLVVPGQHRCRAHLVDQRLLVETTAAGQARLVAPPRARRRPVYPTGVQVSCVSCAAAGRDKQGLPRDGAGSDPLCMSCWRGRTDRRDAAQRHHLVAALRDRLDDVQDVVDTGCAACGEPEPVPTCWLCGYSYLEQARADHAHAQALEAAGVDEHFAQLAETAEARERVDELTAWIQRLMETLSAFNAGDSWGRPVWMLADLLARDAASRASRRGRRSALGRVGAVLAVDADRRSGRRAMPGRAKTALLAGCDSTRPVTDAWRRAEALGWHTRVEQGRRLSYAERCATGRAQARAVFDITPLHRGDTAAQTAHVPAALTILAELLDHARTLLTEAQDRVDELDARAGGWVDHRERVRRHQMRQAVASARDHARDQAENFRTPHTVSLGMSVYSSLSRGLLIPPPIAHSHVVAGRQSRRKIGASRSPITSRRNSGVAWSRPVGRPRPVQAVSERPRRSRPRPEWAEWAYDLARALRGHWRWLADVPLPRVAATLGAALSREWTAEVLATWASRQRPRPLLSAPRDPVAYLKAILEDVLTGPDAPPNPAARHAVYRRAAVATDAETRRADRASWCGRCDRHRRIEVDDHDQVVPCPRCSGADEPAVQPRRPAAARSDHPPAGALPAAEEGDWPDVAQAGSGILPERC